MNYKTLALNFKTTNGNQFISAASGLVLADNKFFVISDNDLNLALIDRASNERQLIPILPGILPTLKKERKKKKPDFETLFLITDPKLPASGLIAFPSGSSPQRFLGVFVPFNKQVSNPFPIDTPDIIRFDLTRLFKTLIQETRNLNIEGVIVENQTVLLFHRGNSKNEVNKIFEIAKSDLVDIILQKNNDQPIAIRKTSSLELGDLEGVKLTITDAALFEGRKFFLAAAEDSDNPIDDGKIKGTVFGELLNSGQTKILAQFKKQKFEGLAIAREQGQVEIHMVNDNDDPDSPSQILTFQINL